MCSNTALGHSVTPTPREARELPNSPCRPLEWRPSVCGFGARSGTTTIALVGDSHAGHWRAALDVVAQARGWRGLSITHSSCPLSEGRSATFPSRALTRVRAWKDEVFAWFEHIPRSSTVFVGGLTGRLGRLPESRRSRLRDLGRGLPATRGARCPRPSRALS